jgi:hypothetical protein
VKVPPVDDDGARLLDDTDEPAVSVGTGESGALFFER